MSCSLTAISQCNIVLSLSSAIDCNVLTQASCRPNGVIVSFIYSVDDMSFGIYLGICWGYGEEGWGVLGMHRPK